MYYEKALVSGEEVAAHNELCAAGVARVSCRLVDLRKGISLALKLSNKVKKECAAILQNLKELTSLTMYLCSLESQRKSEMSDT